MRYIRILQVFQGKVDDLYDYYHERQCFCAAN